MILEGRFERLADEWAIRDTLARYWRGIDRRDVALVASTYHADGYDDHGYYKGPVAGFLESLEPDVWAYFDNTQHFSGHISVEIDRADANAALAESYAEAHHVRRSEDGTFTDLVYGLRYVDRFTCRGGEWRIAHRVCTWDWSRSDSSAVIPLPDTYARGAHSKEDPVYRHPLSTGVRASAEELIAKQACLDTLARYARGVDRCDPERVRATYHADAYDDHGGYQGDASGFVEWVKPTVMDAFDCTMHKLGNGLIEIRDGRAFAETYAIAHHVLAPSEAEGRPGSDMIMGVRYLDELEDRGDGWKIADRRMTFEWERSVAIGSQAAYEGFSSGRRDGTDPVLASSAVRVAMPAGLEEVNDRAEIYAALVRYCRGVDRRDRALVSSTYHADAYDDHGTYKGDVEGFLDFVERDVHARFRTTMHKLGQALIEVDGDSATSESYAICHHVVEEDGRDTTDMVMGIRYLDRFEKREDEWRIARRELLWEWIRFDSLEALDPDWTHGMVDETDPVLR